MSFPQTQTKPVLRPVDPLVKLTAASELPPKHLRLRQVAKRLSISYDSARRIFMGRPGVVGITKQNPEKRSYTLWLVPESVFNAVVKAFTVGGAR
jgi:hypothetical protein